MSWCCRVPAAIPGKDSIELEVFGMSGVPEGASPGMPLPEGDAASLSPPNANMSDTTGCSPAVPGVSHKIGVRTVYLRARVFTV